MGTITVSDIDADKGMAVELAQRTEDIVTKMNITWRLTNVPAYEFSAEQANQSQYMVLRHNVQRYGLWEKDYDWYIFNQPDIILKMATFWLIRLSSAWKRVKFRTYLHKLPFEAFDCLTLNATGYVASGPVKMVVEKADYNSAENCIDFECATPVRGGTLVQDSFYWPAALPQSTTWPPAGRHRQRERGRRRPGNECVRDASCWRYVEPPRANPCFWAARTWCSAVPRTGATGHRPTWALSCHRLCPAIALYRGTPGIAQHSAVRLYARLVVTRTLHADRARPAPLVIDLSTTRSWIPRRGSQSTDTLGTCFGLPPPATIRMARWPGCQRPGGGQQCGRPACGQPADGAQAGIGRQRRPTGY